MKMIKKIKGYFSYKDDKVDFACRMWALSIISWVIVIMLGIFAEIFAKYPHLVSIAEILIVVMGIMTLLEIMCVLWLIIGLLGDEKNDKN